MWLNTRLESGGRKLSVAAFLCVLAVSSVQAVDLISLLMGKEPSAKRTSPVVACEPAEKPDETPVEKPVDEPVEKIVEKIVIVERTNVVEKVVVDRAREEQLLARERQLLARQTELVAERDRLASECRRLAEEKKAADALLAKERDRCQRLERVIPKEDRQFADKNVKISAPSVFHDKKEGYTAFSGGVRVKDEEYELFADRAYVFSDASNSVKRVVALDHVAMTNGAKRAYGVKASYHRQTGMVVLYGDGDTPAVVRDESRVDDQEVVGEKIKFWINSQQVEVLKARIKAPVQGGEELRKGVLGR